MHLGAFDFLVQAKGYRLQHAGARDATLSVPMLTQTLDAMLLPLLAQTTKRIAIMKIDVYRAVCILLCECAW